VTPLDKVARGRASTAAATIGALLALAPPATAAVQEGAAGHVVRASGYLYRLGGYYGAAVLTASDTPGEVAAPAVTDGREFTYAFAGVPAIAGRTYACVGAIAAGSGDGRDEVQPICLTRCRPDPEVHGPDPVRPRVSWLTPEAGDRLSGLLRGRTRRESNHCEALPTDNRGIESVDFLVDGYFLNIEYSPPYSCVWDTTTVPDGRHILRAVVHDTSGNARDARIEVDVRNAGLEPPVREEPPPWPVGELVPAVSGPAPLGRPVSAAPLGAGPLLGGSV
jgi:hypothetical protein